MDTQNQVNSGHANMFALVTEASRISQHLLVTQLLQTRHKKRQLSLYFTIWMGLFSPKSETVLLENNFTKWNTWKEEGKERAKSIPTKYGQSGTHWASSMETITQYNEFYAMVKDKRSEANNGDVEKQCWKTGRRREKELCDPRGSSATSSIVLT